MTALALFAGGRLAASAPAHAAQADLCAVGPTQQSLAQMSESALRQLTCEKAAIDLGEERNVMRLDVPAGEAPSFLISRTARFDSLEITVPTDEGVFRSDAGFGEIRATFFDRQFAVPLPR
ncbi:hypothetical protein [Erythrobacter sp.]|uniref:hypothetical protein n=1 Tax=Erythrobacter sp. TaxID=1042 RepID=UPI002ED5A93F